jgi:NtrC-family two-component system sensor histidine kinase KinB
LIDRSSMGRFLVRRLLPAVIIMPAVLAWLRLEGQWAGLYGTTVGTVLFTLANVLIISALILWSARLLDQIEARRRQTDEALRESQKQFRNLFDNPVLAGILLH